MHNSSKFLAFALLMLLPLLSGCLNEDTQPQPERSVEGRIVLSLSGIEVFTDAETRAAQTLDDYTGYVFTLNGTAVESGTVTNQEITFDGDVAIVEAGRYTLTASNLAASQEGNGCPYYEGTSAEFNLGVGGTQPVSIAMGAPKNAKLTIVEDDATFSSKYENAKLAIGGRTFHLSPEATGTIAYLPAGTSVSYTVSAAAKRGSHVTDITSATGTIDLTAGCYHTLTLRANPVSGELIPVVSGTHTGKFD